MKKLLSATISLSAAIALATPLLAAAPAGEALFKERCASCHPDGGNIINPAKTLKKKDLAVNKLTESKKMVAYMRKPGPGMTPFDAKSLPDKDAAAIASYILKTFK